jgi:endonuclease/exonuclease/phosphatase family metal-dependent hydrolase
VLAPISARVQERVERPTNRHAAEVPLWRRPGVVATGVVAGIVASAVVVLLVLGPASPGSSTAGVGLSGASARMSTSTVVAPAAPAASSDIRPPAYVASPSTSPRARRAVPAMRVVRAGVPLRRWTRAEVLHRRVARVLAGAAPPDPFRLLVGTLNVLGSQHTSAPGGYGPGVDRAAREAALIEARGLDVVGLQEVQRDQLGVFEHRLPGYAVFPETTQSSQGYRLQVAYRTSRFIPVDSGQVSYLFSHMWIPLPWLLLRDDATGGEFYVIDAHNSPEGEQTERLASSAIEIRLIDQLRAEHPVILLGDLNEGAPVYCRLAAATGVTSSGGGRYDGGCSVPAGPIDWLMGTAGITWSDDHVDPTPRATGMSDHALIYATASIQDGAPAAD